MPLFEYQCDSCGERFERIQKFSDPAVTTCPTCGGAAHRQMSSPAIQFKGSGFYITDYARKGEKGEKEEKGERGEKGEKPATPDQAEKPGASTEAGSSTKAAAGESAGKESPKEAAKDSSKEAPKPPPAKPTPDSTT